MDIKEFEKLKVGDKVKIVDEKTGKAWSPSGKMDRWLGKIMTIRDIAGSGIVRMREDVDECGGGSWYWYPHMIDCKVDEPATIEMHIIRGNKTVVRLSNGKVGIARCNPQDSFDVYEGLRIAAARAYGKEPFAKTINKVKRPAEDGEYVEIVNPDEISTASGLKKGQIRRVYIFGLTGSSFVNKHPDDPIEKVLVSPSEYVVLENHNGKEV